MLKGLLGVCLHACMALDGDDTSMMYRIGLSVRACDLLYQYLCTCIMHMHGEARIKAKQSS